MDDYYTKTKPVISHFEQAGGPCLEIDDDELPVDYEKVMSRVDWVIFARQLYYQLTSGAYKVDKKMFVSMLVRKSVKLKLVDKRIYSKLETALTLADIIKRFEDEPSEVTLDQVVDFVQTAKEPLVRAPSFTHRPRSNPKIPAMKVNQSDSEVSCDFTVDEFSDKEKFPNIMQTEPQLFTPTVCTSKIFTPEESASKFSSLRMSTRFSNLI